MRKSELSSYLSFAKKLINVSEKIVKQNTPSKIKVNFKIDRSPVTKIDMQVEKSLRKLISQKYPEQIFCEKLKLIHRYLNRLDVSFLQFFFL